MTIPILTPVTSGNTDVTVFDATGKITLTASLSPATYNYYITKYPNLMILGTFSPTTYYIVDGVPTLRPVSTITAPAILTVPADGTTPITLTGVSSGAPISVTGPVPLNATGDGTPVALTFSKVGSYTVTVQSFPNLDFKVTINAT